MRKFYLFTVVVLAFVLLAGLKNAVAQNKYAISLDGGESFFVNDDASNHLDLSNAWTFEAWIKVESYTSGNYDCIMDRRTVFSFYLIDDDDDDYAVAFAARNSSGNIIAYLDCDGTGSTSADMQFGTWYHVAATYDGTTARLYVNGTEHDSSTDPDWNLTASTNALNIGGRYWGSYSRQMEDADIDEIRVSNVARSINDMQTSTHFEEYVTDPNTVLLMHLNDKSDPPSYDSGTGLSGTSGDDDITPVDYTSENVADPYFLLRPKYRSKTSGNWWTLSTWEVEHGENNWIDASNYPDEYTELISIKTGDTVVVDDYANAYNFTIDGAVTIPPASGLTVESVMDNNSGTTGLVIEADNTGMGSLIEHTGVEATIEQYISQDAWHLVSIPVTSAKAGVYTDLYLYEWSEQDSVFTNIYDTLYDLTVTYGYYAYSASSLSSPTDVEFKGTTNTGDKAVTWMTYTSQNYSGEDGWNLAGNPYPSGIQWNNTWSQQNLTATVYVFDAAASGNWITYNYVTGLGDLTNGDIPPTQGFFVWATAANPSMTIPGNARVHLGSGIYKNSITPINAFAVSVTGKLNNYSDRLYIAVDNQSSNGFDSEYDAYELPGFDNAPQVYALVQDDKYAVDVIPAITEDMSVPLGFKAGSQGEYTFTFENADYFYGNDVYLEDKAASKFINIQKANSYTFYSEKGIDEARFVLHFNPVFANVGDQEQDSDVSVYSFGRKILVNYKGTAKASMYVYDITGKLVATAPVSTGLNEMEMSVREGYYVVKIVSGKTFITHKVFIN